MFLSLSPEKLLPKPLLMGPLSNGAYSSVLQVSAELYKAMYRKNMAFAVRQDPVSFCENNKVSSNQLINTSYFKNIREY